MYQNADVGYEEPICIRDGNAQKSVNVSASNVLDINLHTTGMQYYIYVALIIVCNIHGLA